ncbi:MAG TPA: hypothetical protein V6C85_02385 [Allocoleopsis sp.]
MGTLIGRYSFSLEWRVAHRSSDRFLVVVQCCEADVSRFRDRGRY